MTTMTISEARTALPELVDRVIAGEEITITRHGAPVAVVVRPDALRTRRRAQQDALDAAARIHERLEAARMAPLPTTGISAERAEELIAEIRAGRDAR